MFYERVGRMPIKFIRQRYQMGCVPTSTAMVLSGFGIRTSEQELVDTYFPSAKLPKGHPDAGIYDDELTKGLVAITIEMGLANTLRVDVFEPSLWSATSPKVERTIVPVTPDQIKPWTQDENSGRQVSYYRTLEH